MTNDTPSPRATPPATGRGVKIALGLSLALNLLIVGLVGGAVLGRGGAPERGDPAASLRSLAAGPLTEVLSESERGDLRRGLAESRDRIRPDTVALMQAFREFSGLLTAEPFDREALAEILGAQRGRMQSLMETGHEVLLDELEAMSPAQRADLAQRLERRLRRLRPRPLRD